MGLDRKIWICLEICGLRVSIIKDIEVVPHSNESDYMELHFFSAFKGYCLFFSTGVNAIHSFLAEILVSYVLLSAKRNCCIFLEHEKMKFSENGWSSLKQLKKVDWYDNDLSPNFQFLCVNSDLSVLRLIFQSK